MSLTKVNYIDNETIITAKNLNDIQDNIIELDNNIKNIKFNPKAVARNLLDNSDFTNPVNQRGQTTYASYFATTFDRWLISSESQDSSVVATVSKTSDGLKFSAASNGKVVFGQRLPAEALSNNKTYTAVACKSNGMLVWGTIGDYVATYGFWAINFNLSNNDVLVWAALYEGEYTADNLPVYQPKGYGAELAECMLYYQKSDFIYHSEHDLDIITEGHQFYVPMRINPTFEIFDDNGDLGKCSIWNSYGIGSIAVSACPTNKYGIEYLLFPETVTGLIGYGYEASADL